jgi:hypothetical protein
VRSGGLVRGFTGKRINRSASVFVQAFLDIDLCFRDIIISPYRVVLSYLSDMFLNLTEVVMLV